MDDIKETVRNSGEKLCRAVTSLTIRLCDVTLTDISHASQAMDIVLPVLLGEGILSKVDSIRKASIAVVMKLAKVTYLFEVFLSVFKVKGDNSQGFSTSLQGAGIALRPHLSDLVCCMLESLSSLEDQGLNYVEV